jgi:hypothetical protein
MVRGDLEERLPDIFAEGPESDRRLVQRVLAADERAFEQFFERMAPGLFRFALGRMGNEADAGHARLERVHDVAEGFLLN